MDMNEADILAGRAKSVSARHYAIYELDRISNAYIQAWANFVDPAVGGRSIGREGMHNRSLENIKKIITIISSKEIETVWSK